MQAPKPQMIWVVCPMCEGEGKVLHEAFRGVAYTREDLDNDPDFTKSYFGGDYDVPCPECKGRTTVQDLDWDTHSRFVAEHKGVCPLPSDPEYPDNHPEFAGEPVSYTWGDTDITLSERMTIIHELSGCGYCSEHIGRRADAEYRAICEAERRMGC